jgi:hypothetical protein
MSITRTQEQEKWINEIREKTEVGLQELEHGEGIDLDIVMKQLRDKIRNVSPH